MPEIKTKPIRPTKVTVNSEEEYREFIAFAEGRDTSNIDIINEIRKSFANHKRLPKRKRA